ncbi:PDR/VanB family oxidoreductase [Gordonia sp. CPCC 205515]|uniref:PDR/VanB family oxidoreductase n=1 Tax=Gordonia sp. CPCC 205515 TaxID=3140791 RepID=UPI003AF37D1E
MNYLTAPLTDVDNPTRTLQAMGRVARGYSRIFAEGRHADRLSPSGHIRRTGFDLRLMVTGSEGVADGVRAITLCRPDRTPLPRWTPGAHIDVFTPQGRQRHYSLTGDPADVGSYRIAIRRLPDGTGSVEMHRLRVGDLLTVRGPRNAFNFAAAPSYLFLAGGIGITPIAPMVRAAAAAGAEWRLIYTGASRASMPFVDELVALDSSRVEVRPDDECGTPDVAEMVSHASARAAVYLCGPTGMLDAVRSVRDVAAAGIELHSERFSPPPVVGGQRFTVALARTGTEVEVAADETVLEAVRRVKPDVRYSCRQGFCGACRVRVLDGEVDHRDRVLIGEQRDDSMMICVSRAADRAVLDL